MTFITAVDCLWSGFSDWSECSVTCGRGSQSRDRKILQAATEDGEDCVGEATETRECSQEECTDMCEDGEVIFSDWSECSASCGAGVRSRRGRVGDDCEEVVETEDCGLEPCDQDLVTEDVVIETTTLQSEKAVADSHNETGNIL